MRARTPQIHIVETPTLGDRSYVAHDGRVAVIVDPQRDIDRILNFTRSEGLRITHVFETHIHNDYVSGGLALARETGASYYVNEEDSVKFDRTPVRDGEAVQITEDMTLRAIGTPGHTFTHLSYALEHDGNTQCAFTGGSMLYGATGRPDLLGPEHTDSLVRLQYRSAQRLARELPDLAEIFPTHGFGSFCAATQAKSSGSTMRDQKFTNPALTESEEDYVRSLLDGLDVFPAYYVYMSSANLAGPDAPDLSSPRIANREEIRDRIEAGEWVVDLRKHVAFAAGFVPGTLNFGVDGPFSTYLGWLIDWGSPVTLIGETQEQIRQAQRELVRIGIDRPAAVASGAPEELSATSLARFPVAGFSDLAARWRDRPPVVLDVRRVQEFRDAHIPGAVNIPIHELPQRVHEIPGGDVWVHCATGYRSGIAASFTAAAGRQVVSINDKFRNAASAGLPLVTGTSASPVT